MKPCRGMCEANDHLVLGGLHMLWLRVYYMDPSTDKLFAKLPPPYKWNPTTIHSHQLVNPLAVIPTTNASELASKEIKTFLPFTPTPSTPFQSQALSQLLVRTLFWIQSARHQLTVCFSPKDRHISPVTPHLQSVSLLVCLPDREQSLMLFAC
jgi:hypothetical protein